MFVREESWFGWVRAEQVEKLCKFKVSERGEMIEETNVLVGYLRKEGVPISQVRL